MGDLRVRVGVLSAEREWHPMVDLVVGVITTVPADAADTLVALPENRRVNLLHEHFEQTGTTSRLTLALQLPSANRIVDPPLTHPLNGCRRVRCVAGAVKDVQLLAVSRAEPPLLCANCLGVTLPPSLPVSGCRESSH
jgi:hypothetical protein